MSINSAKNNLVCACAKLSQSCPTPRFHGLYSSPGSSVHRILQARILEWVAIPFSRGSSRPRGRTWASSVAGRFFTVWATREALREGHAFSDLQLHLGQFLEKQTQGSTHLTREAIFVARELLLFHWNFPPTFLAGYLCRRHASSGQVGFSSCFVWSDLAAAAAADWCCR